jgi:hypothetical protein
MKPAERAIVKDAMDAAEWMAKVLSNWGYKADFTLDSLKEVDRFLDEQVLEGNPKPGGLLSRNMGAHVFALGAYVGKVIRRQGNGHWQGNDGDDHPEITLAVRLKSGDVFWPTQRVIKRFKNGAEDGIFVYGFALIRD